MDEAVTYRCEGRVAYLTLNRADKFNCINLAVLEGLIAGIDQAELTEGVRAILLTAEGEHFCTGADLDEVRKHSHNRETLDAFISHGHVAMQRLQSSSLPVIAAIQGYCLAGGMELMLCADVVFAAAEARIGCQHARYGLVPGWGGSQRLPRLVGQRRAMELMYSARWLEAEVAKNWGLVNHVVGNQMLHSEASQFTNQLAQRNPEGLSAMKRLVREGSLLPMEQALRFEQSVAVPALMSENVAEGLKAFHERREPEFSDKA